MKLKTALSLIPAILVLILSQTGFADNNQTIQCDANLFMLELADQQKQVFDVERFREIVQQSGATVSFQDNGFAGITVSATGIKSDLMDLFKLYLEKHTDVVGTKNYSLNAKVGESTNTKDIQTTYYNLISQTLEAKEDGSTAVGTMNSLTPMPYGTEELTFTPVSFNQGEIQAQLKWVESAITGKQVIYQYLNTKNGAVEVPTEIPVTGEWKYSSEVQLKPGDMLIAFERNQGITDAEKALLQKGGISYSEKRRIKVYAIRMTVEGDSTLASAYK